jgi:hypothetical protein
LGFLDTDDFAAKIPGFEGWIFLDFLGFSRQNRDLSMGYDGFSLNKISRRFRRRVSTTKLGRGAPCGLGFAEGQDCSCGKLNSISDYLQSIVVRAVLSAVSASGRYDPGRSKIGPRRLRREKLGKRAVKLLKSFGRVNLCASAH